MASNADRPADLTRDRVLRIETPEHVSIEFPLAGPGSRFGALLVDAVVVVVALLLALLLLGRLNAIGLISDQFGAGLMILVGAALFWGYFFTLEVAFDGRTVGKRLFGIRTVLDGGHPLTAQAAAIRNLLRIVDLQPGTTCLLGGVTILLDGKGRRLGDLAAGTVVVRDLPIEFPQAVEVGVAEAAPRLSDGAFAALEGFVERAPELPEQARRKLAIRIRRSLANVDATEGAWASSAEYLEAFYDDERRRRAAARMSTAAGAPAAAALLRIKRERWTALRNSVRALRRSRLRGVSEDAVSDFAARYRALSADLARARTYGASPRTVFALEHLVGAAHNVFYRPVGRGFARLRAFLTSGFPALVRRLALPLGVAASTFLAPAVVGYTLVLGDADNERLLADAGMIERAEKAAADPTIDYRDTWESAFMGFDALSVQLIANNVQVSFIAFAGGLLAGLGTLVILSLNGLHLGVALAVFANRGVLDNIGMFVIAHGPIELTAIVISGAAGLWMGSALWFPGREARARVLVRRAREAVALMVGVVAMLVVAGIIEGFISPARLPDAVKIFAALAALAWLLSYLTLAGRGRAREGQPEGEDLRDVRAA